MPANIKGALVSYKTFNGYAPEKGARVLSRSYDFSSVSTIEDNFTDIESRDVIEGIQAIYVDNSANSQPLTITCQITQHALTWPAGAQGFLPAFSVNPPVFSLQSTGAISVNVIYCTFAMPAATWFSSAVISRDAGSAGTDYSVNTPAKLANLLLTIPANNNRNNITIQNQSATQIQVVINEGTSNEVIILLEALGSNMGGGFFSSEQNKGQIKVYAASAAAQVAAWEE